MTGKTTNRTAKGACLLIVAIATVLLTFSGYRVVTRANRNYALLDAVRRGDSKAVVLLLRDGADANVREDRVGSSSPIDWMLSKVHRPRLGGFANAGPPALYIAVSPE